MLWSSAELILHKQVCVSSAEKRSPHFSGGHCRNRREVFSARIAVRTLQIDQVNCNFAWTDVPSQNRILVIVLPLSRNPTTSRADKGHKREVTFTWQTSENQTPRYTSKRNCVSRVHLDQNLVLGEDSTHIKASSLELVGLDLRLHGAILSSSLTGKVTHVVVDSRYSVVVIWLIVDGSPTWFCFRRWRNTTEEKFLFSGTQVECRHSAQWIGRETRNSTLSLTNGFMIALKLKRYFGKETMNLNELSFVTFTSV